MGTEQTINFIIPYFGEFPNYFQLFLNSCECNKDIIWTIVTDNDKEYIYPPNVHVVLTSFEELRQSVQKKFDFDINLDKPYKLCDYRPAYAYIFKDIVEGFMFWGYCDIDVIFGRLRVFLTEERLNNNDKLGVLGHLTLIKNTKENNELFMRDYCGERIYKKVLSSEGSFNFDEEFSEKININTFFKEKGRGIFDLKDCIADIYTKSSNFKLIKGDRIERRKGVFVWNNGELQRYFVKNGIIEKKEYAYIHLQKRRMRIENTNYMRYKIIPNSFEDLEVKNIVTIQDYNKIRKYRPNFHYFRIRANNLKKKWMYH